MMMIIISMCNQGKCFTIYGTKLLTVSTVEGWRFCDLFDVTFQCVSRVRLWHSKASCEWQYRRIFCLFSLALWSKSHKRRRWGFNFTQQYRISLSQFLFPVSSTIEIIQSALTDPKVINLSNEHFPPLSFFSFLNKFISPSKLFGNVRMMIDKISSH